ncbi:MAG: TAXI family TRAP transporter solute-binding subunit [Verrucomicrobiota bacterium]
MERRGNRQHLGYLGFIGLILTGVVVAILLRHQANRPSADLNFASGQSGGLYVSIANDLKKVIEDENPKITIHTQQTDGSVANIQLLEAGEVQLALTQNDVPGNTQLRTIAPIHHGYLHFITRRDSNIKSLQNLRNKRVATGSKGSGSYRITTQLFDYFGLTEHIQLSQASVETATAQLQNGEIDAWLVMLGFRAPALMELLTNPDIALVSLPANEVDALEGFVMSYPFCSTKTIPPLSYSPQQLTAIDTLTIPTLLVTTDKQPNALIEHLTENLFSNRPILRHQHPAFAEMHESFDRSELAFPLHPGARRYFDRNEPGFIVRYAEAMGFGLSLLLAAYGVFTAGRQWILQKQKDRIDEYYLDLESILERLNEEKLSPKDLTELRSEIHSIRQSALKQLAAEKLQPDASFRILQQLLTSCEDKINQLA